MYLSNAMYSRLTQALSGDRADELDRLLADDDNLDVGYRDPEGCTLLFMAAREGAVECVRRLLSAGAQINDRMPDEKPTRRRTALNCAIAVNRLDVADVLLAAGASIRIPDHYGETPLHVLISSTDRAGIVPDSSEIARRTLLLGRIAAEGCPINQRDLTGLTPLMAAIRREVPLPLVQTLLDAGADPNLPDARGEYLIHSAIEEKHLPLIRILTLAGANLDARNLKGETALHLALDLVTVSELIELGASVGCVDNDGRDPFHYRIVAGQYDQVDQPILLRLLSQGADPRQPDYAGKTAIDALEDAAAENPLAVSALRSALAARDARAAMRAASAQGRRP
jgi:ankyrin repeat protein